MKKSTAKNGMLSQSTIKKQVALLLDKQDFNRQDLFFLINYHFRMTTFQVGAKIGVNPSHLSSILKGSRPLDPVTIQLVKLVLFKDINSKNKISIRTESI